MSPVIQFPLKLKFMVNKVPLFRKRNDPYLLALGEYFNQGHSLSKLSRIS